MVMDPIMAWKFGTAKIAEARLSHSHYSAIGCNLSLPHLCEIHPSCCILLWDKRAGMCMKPILLLFFFSLSQRLIFPYASFVFSRLSFLTLHTKQYRSTSIRIIESNLHHLSVQGKRWNYQEELVVWFVNVPLDLRYGLCGISGCWCWCVMPYV